MADINQVITLGIGTPAGIPEFLTFGLQIAEIVIVVGRLDGTLTMYPALNGECVMHPGLDGTATVNPGSE